MEMIEHPDISAMMRYGRVERYDDMNDVGFLHGYIFRRDTEDDEWGDEECDGECKG